MRNLDFFGFFPVTEASTREVGTIAGKLAHEFSSTASGFGDGVKSISATLLLTNPRGLGRNHRLNRPVFHPGLRKIEAFGMDVELEDELEFSLRPEFSAVQWASDKAAISNAIASAITDVRDELEEMAITDFDMRTFLSEFEAFFTSHGRAIN